MVVFVILIFVAVKCSHRPDIKEDRGAFGRAFIGGSNIIDTSEEDKAVLYLMLVPTHRLTQVVKYEITIL